MTWEKNVTPTHLFNLNMEPQDTKMNDFLLSIANNGMFERPFCWSDEYNGYIWERVILKNGEIVHKELFIVEDYNE